MSHPSIPKSLVSGSTLTENIWDTSIESNLNFLGGDGRPAFLATTPVTSWYGFSTSVVSWSAVYWTNRVSDPQKMLLAQPATYPPYRSYYQFWIRTDTAGYWLVGSHIVWAADTATSAARISGIYLNANYNTPIAQATRSYGLKAECTTAITALRYFSPGTNMTCWVYSGTSTSILRGSFWGIWMGA